MAKHIGKQTMVFSKPVSVLETAVTVGTKEGEGPLGKYFDSVLEDNMAGCKCWETAESTIVKHNLQMLMRKNPAHIDYIISGDLLNQCCASTYGIRELEIPFFGIFSACATFGEALSLAAVLVDSGGAENVIAAASSHFCSAERQFRFPLELGNQRPPTATYTVTGDGAAIVSNADTPPYITAITTGKIVDYGIKDSSNMGAAMAPAAADCIYAHFSDTGRTPDYYDLIITGELGYVGKDLVLELLDGKKLDISKQYSDCGIEIFDRETQDTHSGGSGCACSAAVFGSMLYRKLKSGILKRILFIPTGALMSTDSINEGESIAATAHAVAIESEAVKWNI